MQGEVNIGPSHKERELRQGEGIRLLDGEDNDIFLALFGTHRLEEGGPGWAGGSSLVEVEADLWGGLREGECL